MSELLSGAMISGGNDIYHTPEFLGFVRSHKNYLKQNCVSAPLDPGIVHKFEYNFMSLLVEMKYPVEDIIIFMVVNDLNCVTEMDSTFTNLLVPDPGVVENLKSLYRQTPGRI